MSLHLELIQAAQRLLPELRARSREIDALRQLPQDLAEQMAGLGFYRLCTPEALGGLDAAPATLFEVCETLAMANGSAAWCVFIGSTSQYLLGALPTAQIQEMLTDVNVITSGVFADSGTAQFETRNGEPGYLINGYWRWGSGCHNAAWVSGGIHEVDAAGNPTGDDGVQLTRVFFKPREIEILDSWHVSGLRGSGSSDYTADNVWVPAQRLASTIDQTEFKDLPVYRFPRFALLSLPIGAIALGMARACISEVVNVAKQKTPQGSRRTLAQRGGLHRDLAVADTSLAAARMYFYSLSEEVWQHSQTQAPTLTQRRQLRAANIHAVTTAIAVIDKMYTVVGGTSVFEDSCLQQHFRDVHVASQHMMVAEPVMELTGKVMLGLVDDTPVL